MAEMTENRQDKYGVVLDEHGRPLMRDEAELQLGRDVLDVSVDANAGDGLPDEYELLMAEICEPDGEQTLLKKNRLPKVSSPSPNRFLSMYGLFTPSRRVDSSSFANMAQATRRSPDHTNSRSVALDPDLLSSNRVVGFFPESPDMEQYRLLRAKVLNTVREKGGNAIMITSAFPGEGKTLTAINLALTFAKGCSENALLVDCDLRRQRICETLGFNGGKGLADYILDGCEMSEMITWPGVERLVVISGGRTVLDSSEMLSSFVMKELVEEMKGRYCDRYVFFDVPAVLSRADALAFAPFVDHILFVVRAGETLAPHALRALKMLPQEKIMGVVLNGSLQ